MANLLVMGAAVGALVSLGAAEAEAQQRSVGGSPIVPISSGGGGPRIVPLSNGGHFQHSSPFGGTFHGGRKRGHFPGFIIVEREVPVIVEREVVKETPPPQAVPLPQNSGGGEKARAPYVVGRSYASLPGGCMKLIEGSASYYYCGGGEWYRLAGKQYRAVARP